ncbi:lytic transglycosylase [Legionella fallonii]|uniref:Membrane bound lytic murein transglycosylase D n=1 Tax=Legionella fallonii LLAP-10 TaxID=1212491 RepID=A0A098G2F7_9GAMM|nr:LysM peptidoglycan-binding domain-containing protein [Legionella fallonii]CEG56667.1 Membrane bound lytic murein transglycosylase D [Legionella fallonii LLAP-10]
MKFKLFIIKSFLFCILIFIGTSNHAFARNVPNIWDVLRSEFKLNHELSRPEVREQIRWLAAHPGYIQKVCNQSEPYIYHIVAEIRKRKLPGELALLPMIESAFNPFAYSRVGAAGLWQFMPETGTAYGLKQDWWFDGRRSINQSTDAALNYLFYLNKFFNGSWIFAIAAYDAGEGTISRAIKALNRRSVDFWSLPVPSETKIYVPRLLALSEIINNPGLYKISLPYIPYRPYFEEVNVGSQIDLSHAAKLAGISYKELIKLNPGFNRWATAPYEPFRLLIPAEKVGRFILNLANVPEEKRVSWRKHQVRPGDNLDNIAARYHTTVNLVKKLNQLKANTVIPNQPLLIPTSKNAVVEVRKESSPLLPTIRPLLAPSNRRIIHIVQNNDSFEKIQRLYGVSGRAILSWNNLPDAKLLRPGQQLIIWRKVRQPVEYTIRRGDRLDTIAKLYQTQVEAILRLNPGLNKNQPLILGQKILVG